MKVSFLPHAVAYLDILGFSRFIEEAETNQEKLESLEKLIEVMSKGISSDGKNSVFPGDLGMRYLSYSDSIVISAPISDKLPYPAVIAVSIKAIQITHMLLDMGFLSRGAIAVGNAYCTDSNIIGTGFQEAVEREKTTKHPQIVLTESAEQELKKLKNEGSWYWNSSFFSKDGDQIILNSIHPFQSYFPDKDGNPGDYFRKYRKTILKNLSNDDLDTNARQKWLWFAGLFNSNNKIFSSLTSQEPPPIIDIDEKLPSIIVNCLNQELDPNWMEEFKVPGVKIRINKSI